MTAESESADAAADEAATSWLALVDSGAYAESWAEAAGYFKSLVAEDQWHRSVKGVRSPLGKVISRAEPSRQYSTTLPGAPDGEYVVLQFATSFEHKQSALETVTCMRDADDTWRVSGYFIK